MGCCAYRPLKKQINEYLKPMASFPKNAAMQGLGCEKLYNLIREYEAPHVMIRLMGSKTTNIVCKVVKNHSHSGIVMRSAAPLLCELAKNDRNLKRVKKHKVLHKLQSASAEFPHDKSIARAALSVEGALRGVYRPFETLDTAIEENDADLLVLCMRVHDTNEQVQVRGSQGIVRLSREDAETRKKLCEKGAVPVLVGTLNNFPDNDSVLANCANAFRELGRDPDANRAAGRDGAIAIMVRALMNRALWKETHQALLWGLSRLTEIESNVVHMKEAKLPFVLKEVAVRKEAVYMISEQQRQAYLERKEAEEAAKPREHRPEDEFEAANPYLRFDEVHGDQAKYELPPEEKSAFEEFKDAIETGGSLYKPGAQRKFLTEAEELAYIAKKKRLAQMVRDGSPAADPEQVVNTRGKKQKSAALQYELAGKAQKVALFVPQRLRNVKWEEYTVDGLRATSERKIVEKEVEKEPFKQRTYEETLDLLLGDKAAARRKEKIRRKNMRTATTAAERNVVTHALTSGAYIG